MDHGVPINFHSKAWFVGVPVAYIALVFLFNATNAFPGLARKGTTLNKIMAFEVVCLFCVTYLAAAGFYVWLDWSDNGIYKSLAVDPVYGGSDFVMNHLAIPMFFFQGWNLLLCFVCPDLGDTMMIVHHSLVVVLAYMGMRPYVHAAAMFFFGMAELTNVPLTVIDIFKYLPWLKKSFPQVNEAVRAIFAVLFIILRMVVWPYFCYPFWVRSAQLILRHCGMSDELTAPFHITGLVGALPAETQCHSIFVVVFFVAANLMLTVMQYIWGVTIFGFLFTKPKNERKVK